MYLSAIVDPREKQKICFDKRNAVCCTKMVIGRYT